MSDQDQVAPNKPTPPSTTPRALTSSAPGTGTSSTTSRPATPSSARGLTNITLPSPFSSTNPNTTATIGPQHVRRPSSSSLNSSRRTSLLTPPFAIDSSPSADPLGLPQRLPRQPSSDFAELHNELEFEQEATVNRLLNMIRLQQIRNQQLLSSDDDKASSTGATFDSVNSTRARSPGALSTSAGGAIGGRRVGLSRQPSFTHSQGRPVSRASSAHTSSPMLQPLGTGTEEATGGLLLGGSRDEASFYMAETQMLTRENEMLKKRIKELERQVTELNKGVGAGDSPLVDVRSVGEVVDGKEVAATSVSAK